MRPPLAFHPYIIGLLGFSRLFLLPPVYAPGTTGNSWVQHATYMFDVHGKNVSLLYESPVSVASMSLLPALIDDPALILASLHAVSEQRTELLFHNVPPQSNMSTVRWFQYTRRTHGLCFCCTHKGYWNSRVPGFNKYAPRFERLRNYTSCSNNFWLSAKDGGKFGYSNASLTPTGLVNVSTANSTLSDIYPNFPFMQASFTAPGSICGHMFLKDPNLWFFFDQYATNYHPGHSAGACVGIGFLTFPVQVIDSSHSSVFPSPTSSTSATSPSISFSLNRRERSLNTGKGRSLGSNLGPLGPQCNDEVIVGKQMSSSEGSRVGGGLITGMLTLGSYPGVIAQENRHSIIGLTCRLEKTVNATTKIIRDLQNEIEQLQQIQLQHRLALDYLLARSHTGFCKIVGSQCIVRFHNLNRSIEHELVDLHDTITNNVNPAPWTGFWDFMWSWLPDLGWLRQLFIILISIIVSLVIACCFIQCIPNLVTMCSAFFRKSVPQISLTTKQLYQVKYHVLDTVPPFAEEEPDFLPSSSMK